MPLPNLLSCLLPHLLSCLFSRRYETYCYLNFKGNSLSLSLSLSVGACSRMCSCTRTRARVCMCLCSRMCSYVYILVRISERGFLETATLKDLTLKAARYWVVNLILHIVREREREFPSPCVCEGAHKGIEFRQYAETFLYVDTMEGFQER